MHFCLKNKLEDTTKSKLDSSIDDPVIRQQESDRKKKTASKSKSKKKFKKKDKEDFSFAFSKKLYNPEFHSMKKTKHSREKTAYSNKSLKKRKSNNALFNNLPLSFVKTLGTPNHRNVNNRTPKSQHSTSVWVKKSRKKSKMKRTNSYHKEGFNRRGMIKDRAGGYIGIGNLKYKGIKPKKFTKIFDGILDSKAFNTVTPGNYASDGNRGFSRKSRSKKKRRDYSSGGTPNSNPSFNVVNLKHGSHNSFQGRLELNSNFLSKMKKKTRN